MSAQIISKPPNKTRKDSSDNYRQRSNDNDRLVTNGNNQDGASNEKSSNDGRSKEVMVIGDSMLNNVNSTRKNIFACLFSVHNTISLSRHEQVTLTVADYQNQKMLKLLISLEQLALTWL